MALSMNQGMVEQFSSPAGVKLLAWTTSIVIHLAVLTALVFVGFSPSTVGPEPKFVPTAAVGRINQVKRLVQAEPVVPKPAVRKIIAARLKTQNSELNIQTRVVPAEMVFDASKPAVQSAGGFIAPVPFRNDPSLSAGDVLPGGEVEFFGSTADERKILYIVDCSGSMQGIFGQVQKKLRESIQSLQPDQYFYIIFFGGNRLFEFGDGRLVRANKQTKSAACDFVDSVRPAGQTNALMALERATHVRSGGAGGSSIVYFLTDGFELTTEDAQNFPQKVSSVLMQFAPGTKINTIGFWPQDDDRKMLETIAGRSGGESVFITDGGGKKISDK